MAFRHLLVPVDESTLSAENVSEAVRLAAAWQARITFFHATPDYSATQDGAVLRLVAPQDFAQVASGETHALLLKAKACAAAAGVQCELSSQVGDYPALAIIETARSRGCDLIVMASRGLRGLPGRMHPSQTEQVLRQAALPLLVTRVASNEPLRDSERAQAIILDEHRSIAAVVQGMVDLAKAADEPGGRLDLLSLEGMLTYLREFPLKVHHPKEEQYLHRLLRLRHPLSNTLLQEVEAQHEREHAVLAEAHHRLATFQIGATPQPYELSTLVGIIADSVFKHLSLEERTVLPMAQTYLRDEDWTEILTAFEVNEDPGFGVLPTGEFRRLFTRIAALVRAAGH